MTSGPQFLAPYGVIEIPTGTTARVLDGSFVAAASIPLDQQYIVGQFYPEGLDIVARSYILNMTVKIEDAAFYKKLHVRPARAGCLGRVDFQGGEISRSTSVPTSDSTPSRLPPTALSGQTNPNVYWSATPIAVRAQRQLVMNITGVFTTAPTGDVINLTLVNKRASY